MTQQASELLQKALSLSEEERAELACSLIDSLDEKVDPGAQEAWDEEIARRIHEIPARQRRFRAMKSEAGFRSSRG